MITLTDTQKEIIKNLNHRLYTPEFVEEWINRSDNVFTNPPAALMAMSVKGFFDAVICIENAKLMQTTQNTCNEGE